MILKESVLLVLGFSVIGCVPHTDENKPAAIATSSAAPSSGSGTASPAVVAPTDAAANDPKAAFMAAYRKANTSKDVEQMLALYCLDGVDAEMRDVIRGNVSDALRQPVTDLQIVEPEPGKHGPKVEGGISWRPNLPVVAVMKAQFAPAPPGSGWAITDADYGLGLKNGRYLIVMSIRD